MEHDWVEIYSVKVSPTVSEVVRWCRICGCISVDGSDGKDISPGVISKPQQPQNSPSCGCECEHKSQDIGWVCSSCHKVIRPKVTELDLALCGYLPCSMQEIMDHYEK